MLHPTQKLEPPANPARFNHSDSAGQSHQRQAVLGGRVDVGRGLRPAAGIGDLCQAIADTVVGVGECAVGAGGGGKVPSRAPPLSAMYYAFTKVLEVFLIKYSQNYIRLPFAIGMEVSVVPIRIFFHLNCATFNKSEKLDYFGSI